MEAERQAEIVFEKVSYRYPDSEKDVFTDLSLSLPHGIVSLMGQNGTGKSTLLLLAAGSIVPSRGRVLIRERDTRRLRDESERQALVSAIWQNMEFETEETIGRLLRFVYQNGFHAVKRSGFIEELVEVFELGGILDRRTQEVSKGELQRTILAFSLLYGSPLLVMDEPIFALEDRQKQRAMEYLSGCARREGASLYYSVHELEISRKYSDYILLFSRDGVPRIGPTPEMFDRTRIEEAYEVPFDLLKKREDLYRRYLVELLKVRGQG